MKVVLSPLVSSATGRFQGATMTSWKGLPVVRKFEPPANPKSAGQTNIRNLFTNLTRLCGLLGIYWREPWTAFVQNKPQMARNAWIAQQSPRLKGKTNWNDLLGTPIPPGSPGPASITPTVGSSWITLSTPYPPIPPGWGFLGCTAAILRQSNPSVLQTHAMLQPKETKVLLGNPLLMGFVGLPPATQYYCMIFFTWWAPAAHKAYSAVRRCFVTTLP